MFYFLLRIVLIYLFFRFIFKVIFFFVNLNKDRSGIYQKKRDDRFNDKNIVDVESKEME